MNSRLARFLATSLLLNVAGSNVAIAAGPVGAQYLALNTSASGTMPVEKSASVPAGGEASRYTFSAPPRETAQAAMEIYGPIVEYLSQVTGKEVVFRPASNWITYQTEMRRGAYDLVFDGPHFNSWRSANLQHNILVKVPGEHSFVVVSKKDNDKLRELKQLAGRAVCGMSPPNLGTLTVLKEFDNPARQPVIQDTQGWSSIYKDMQAGRCAAAILPTSHLAKFDPQGNATKILFRARTYPNQAVSAGPRVSRNDQARIAQALATPGARLATAKLREAYAIQGDFVSINGSEYAGVASILKDTWGYQR